MNIPTMFELEEQYKGRSTAEFILNSYKDTKDKQEASLRSAGLVGEVIAAGVKVEFFYYMKEEVSPFIWGKDYWLRDAGEYAYSFYDFFVLGYGDMLKPIPTDEKIFSIFNCVTYALVLKMYDDEKFYNHVKKSGRKFIFF